MPDNRTSKGKKVTYRKRHKSLVALRADDTKHTFDQRLQGALQRKESEPVFFGVCQLSAEENTKVGVFETVDQQNYQEAAKQRGARTRSTSSRIKGPRRPDMPRRTQVRERRVHLSGVQENHDSAQCAATSISPIDPIPAPNTQQYFPTFPAQGNSTPPCTFSALIDSAPPFLCPSMTKDAICGLGIGGINQSGLMPEPIPDPAVMPSFQQMCWGGYPNPYWNTDGADGSLYLPEVYGNQQGLESFPNHSLTLVQYPNGFSG